MTSLSEREKGFEAKFVHDHELMFKITARRNRIFGHWAAGQLQLGAGAASNDYIETVVAMAVLSPGDTDLIKKIWDDLRLAHHEADPALLFERLAIAEGEARRQIMSELH